MVRLILSMLVPILAIGLTGMIVMTIGRLLLSVMGDPATFLALALTILIMVVASVAHLAWRRPAASSH